MTTFPIRLADPRVAAVPVHETFQPLVALGPAFGPSRARVRAGLAARLRLAQVALPVGLRLCVVEGHRAAAVQRGEPAAPHVTGAAVDVTLANVYGDPLDLGDGSHFDAPDIPAGARRHRDQLARALTGVGLVNYPAQWWHWSYGDRYWALMTGAPAAYYGPVADLDDPTTYGDAA